MITYVALLRAINVGGTALVTMAGLRDLVASLGFTGVRSLLQTGNVVFQGEAAGTAALEQLLTREAERRLGLKTTFFVRDRAQWEEIVVRNPFPRQAADDPSHLLAMPLDRTPEPDAIDGLRAAIVGRETVAAGDRCLYLVYPDGIGRSKLTNTLVERKLRVQGTARNWNTVLKILGLARE